MKNAYKKYLLLLPAFVVVQFTYAQQTAETFILETKYLLYLPDGYGADTAVKWPLVIFLHGSGESGDDLAKVKVHGPPKLVERGKKFPFILVSPQAPPRTGWSVEVLKRMLDNLKRKYRVDTDRIYLTGLSMGGFGTWNFASKYPDEFADIAPICGGGNPAEVWKLRHMGVWCFHGAKDDVVLPAQSEKMVNELRKYNPAVKFTLYPGANHNSWDTTYNFEGLYTWLLSHTKYRHKPIKVQADRLQQFEGVYVGTLNKDTIRVEIDSASLVVKAGRDIIPLKPYAASSFYWDDNSIDEIRFVRDEKGVVKSFMLWADEKMEFKKVHTPRRNPK